MVTLARDWSNTVLNNIPSQATLLAQGRATLRARKTLLVAAGFAHQSSSDSVAHSAVTDLWDADSDLVWAAGGVAHSHWVGRFTLSTGFQIYVLLACSTGAGNEHLVNVTWSSSAFSSGSITADPTTTAGNSRAFANKQFLRTPVANSRYHSIRSTSGDVAFLTSPDGSGRFAGGALFAYLENRIPTDNYPCFVIESWLDSGIGCFSTTAIQGVTNTVQWNNDGTVVSSASSGIPNWTFQATGVDPMNQIADSGGGIDGSFPDTAAPVCGGASGTPSNGFRGTLPDMALAPTGSGVAQGREEPPSPATSTTMVVGALWIPNDGQTPSL